MTARRLAALAWLVLAAPSALPGCLLVLDETHYRDAAPGVDTVVPTDDVVTADDGPGVDARPDSAVDAPVMPGDVQPDRAVDSGVCSTAAECDDGEVCTDDTCDPRVGCMHTPNTRPCGTGGDLCTFQSCAGGTCSTSTSNACPVGLVCQPTTGLCACPSGTTTCSDGSCRPAGGCCTNSECTVAQVCVANHCAMCGVLGLFCCAGDTCGGGLLCDPLGPTRRCQPCGNATEPCCPSTGGPTCTGRLHCNAGNVCM